MYRGKLNLVITPKFIVALLTVIACIFFLNYKVGVNYIQPTTHLWIHRSEAFRYNLRKGNFAQTYQFYHPGVTVMYSVSLGSKVFSRFYEKTLPFNGDLFAKEIYPTYLWLITQAVTITISILMMFSLYLIKKLYSLNVAVIFAILFFMDNFFLANSRSVHLDSMLTLFIFITYLLIKLAKEDAKVYLLAALAFALACLTKVVAGVFLLPYLIVIFRSSLHKKVKNLSIFCLGSLAFFVLLWPAMWVDPLKIIYDNLIGEAVVETGTENLGELLLVGPLWLKKWFSYPITMFLRLNILTTFIIMYLLFLKLKNKMMFKKYSELIAISIFYVLIMSISDKKIFRYTLPALPFLILFLSIYFSTYLDKFKSNLQLLVLYAFLIFQSTQLLYYFPNYSLYFNPLYGGIDNARKWILINEGGSMYPEVGAYLDTLQNAETSTISAYNIQMLRNFTVMDTIGIRTDPLTSSRDYLLITPSNGKEFITSQHKLIHEFKFHGNTIYMLFKNTANNEKV